jgi:hypothetical protein
MIIIIHLLGEAPGGSHAIRVGQAFWIKDVGRYEWEGIWHEGQYWERFEVSDDSAPESILQLLIDAYVRMEATSEFDGGETVPKASLPEPCPI